MKRENVAFLVLGIFVGLIVSSFIYAFPIGAKLPGRPICMPHFPAFRCLTLGHGVPQPPSTNSVKDIQVVQNAPGMPPLEPRSNLQIQPVGNRTEPPLPNPPGKPLPSQTNSSLPNPPSQAKVPTTPNLSNSNLNPPLIPQQPPKP